MARAYLSLNFISTNVPGFDLENCFYFFLPLTGYLKSHYFQRNRPFSLMNWFLLKKRKRICKNLWFAAHHILSRKTNSEISRIFTAMGILERLGIQTSSLFVKIWLVCIPESKANFLFSWHLYGFFLSSIYWSLLYDGLHLRTSNFNFGRIFEFRFYLSYYYCNLKFRIC